MDTRLERRFGRLLTLGFLLAIFSTGIASARQGSPPIESDPAWRVLEAEFMSAWQAHQVALQKAQAEQRPPDEMPKSPTNEFWDRCKTFADRGEIAAIQWCVIYSQDPELPVEERNRRRIDLYRGWAKSLPEGPALRAVVKHLISEAHPSRLGLDSATAICSLIAERCEDPGIRGGARLAHGLILLGARDPALAERAREQIALGIEDDPRGELVAGARGKLFQLDHLQVGKRCPDFVAKDVDGKEFKLSDSHGKVVVIDFWGFW